MDTKYFTLKMQKPEIDESGVGVYVMTLQCGKKEWQVGYDYGELEGMKRQLEANPAVLPHWLGHFPHKIFKKKNDPKYKEEKVIPKPMKVWHVPKDEKKPDQPYFMSQVHEGCQKCDPMFNMRQRQDLQEKVFQPGYGLPTMTLEEYADQAQKMFGDMEERQKQADEREKCMKFKNNKEL